MQVMKQESMYQERRHISEMIGKEKLLDIGKQVVRATKGYQAEVILIAEDTNLARFAESSIRQNTSFKNSFIGLRLRKDIRSAISFTNRFDREGLLQLVENAKTALSVAHEDPDLPELQEPGDIPTFDNVPFSENTLRFKPKQRAKMCKEVFQIAPNSVKVFGTVSSGVVEYGFLNSKGVQYYNAVSDAHITVNIKGDNSASGWAQMSSADISKVDHIDVARRALKKCLQSQNPKDIKAGNYPVVLEPLAFEEIITMLGFYAFSARTVNEKRSCLTDKFGTRFFNSKFTLLDQPLNPEAFPITFDWEGTIKRNMTLVDKGVPVQPLYNLRLAKIAGTKSTGHAIYPFLNIIATTHITVQPGNRSATEIINGIERGILVSRMWYVNLIDPMTMTITGMTRDGTFLIEKGEIVAPVNNLRFTVSLVDLLKSDLEFSREFELISPTTFYSFRYPMGRLIPYAFFPEFHFSGVTMF